MRYYQSGLPVSQSEHLWICLHGYGQLAQYFARKFSTVEDKVSLLFPEAPHRFYLQGSAGRVGASWMTKENRLTDIANQQSYLDLLIEAHLAGHHARISVIGFSQGAATASRWVAESKHTIGDLVLWSSVFPEDMDLVAWGRAQHRPKLYQVMGKRDPYYSEPRVDQSAMGLGSVECFQFDGGHEVRPNELAIIVDRIMRKGT